MNSLKSFFKHLSSRSKFYLYFFSYYYYFCSFFPLLLYVCIVLVFIERERILVLYVIHTEYDHVNMMMNPDFFHICNHINNFHYAILAIGKLLSLYLICFNGHHLYLVVYFVLISRCSQMTSLLKGVVGGSVILYMTIGYGVF